MARALLRALADDDGLEVPSPTFTLVQTYDLRIPVAHFDLYRLADSSELDELGFDEALSQGICLVEWPERADDALPASRITLTIAHEGDGRRVKISGPDEKPQRIARTLAIRDFLDHNGHPNARRRHLSGDASIRAYERIYPADGSVSRILMDSPRHKPGPFCRTANTTSSSRISPKTSFPSSPSTSCSLHAALRRRRSTPAISTRAFC